MVKLYDLVRPKDDPFKSIWQVYRVDDNGGVLIHQLGHNPDVRLFKKEPNCIGVYETELYSEQVLYCFPGTFVKLVITEEEIND